MLNAQLKTAQIIMHIDQCVSMQISQVMQHPEFKTLEASWRNLAYLVKQANYQKNIKIQLLTISKKEVFRDLLYAMEIDHSQLFDKIYNRGFGIAGGEPFGIIIGDYTFSNNPNDIQLLQALSQLSSLAFAPFISGASSHLLGLNNFFELGKQPEIISVFQQMEYSIWQKFRTQQNTRFIALVLPQHLLRLPYRDVTIGKNFQYHEPNPDKAYLWGNAAYAFAAVIIKCFTETGWFSNIRGIANENYKNGTVPPVINPNSEKRLAALLTTEVFITDTQERELSNLGFIPLCQQYPGGSNVFYSNSSIQNFSSIKMNNQSISEKAGATLQYLLCACRFAHYLKVIMRNLLGSYITPEECQNRLNDWLWQYVAANEDLGIDKRAKFPLQNGLIKISMSPLKPDVFNCQINLKPYFQLEKLQAEFVFIMDMNTASL